MGKREGEGGLVWKEANQAKKKRQKRKNNEVIIKERRESLKVSPSSFSWEEMSRSSKFSLRIKRNGRIREKKKEEIYRINDWDKGSFLNIHWGDNNIEWHFL